jgi:hypothetical protein
VARVNARGGGGGVGGGFGRGGGEQTTGSANGNPILTSLTVVQ